MIIGFYFAEKLLFSECLKVFRKLKLLQIANPSSLNKSCFVFHPRIKLEQHQIVSVINDVACTDLAKLCMGQCSKSEEILPWAQ